MPVKSLNNLKKLTFKHTKAGIPNPCLRIRKGSGTIFLRNVFDPTTAFNVELTTILTSGKLIPKKESAVHKLKKAKKVTVCLFAKKRKKR